MQLDMFSDVVCPWCYLGHARIRKAIERLGPDGADISIRWRAFQLDPAATADPRDLATAIDRKYGPGAFEVMTERLGALGAEAGIDFRFDRALRVGTVDAHRLIQWTQATQPGATGAVATRLFRAYFTEGANIAEHSQLVALAAEVGLEPDLVGEMLAAGSFAEQVRADQVEAASMGVGGVPAVTFNGAVVIPGAQDVDTMELVLRRLLTKVG